ncbi:hypothetical protein [Aeromicrobium alkaliterrae]|uniref:Uncharacterized protein n=1 Tax=Aeromicrobium alkaliterrae TaxID=302168 RepID=A0ABP4VQR3_9ACTN
MNRWIWLPVTAVLLVVAVVGVQLLNGGGQFEPLRPADACAERDVTAQADGIEGLTERLVLLGIDDAACALGVSREELTLDLAQSEEPTDAQVDAVRAGLLSAVQEMKADGTLPPASALVDEALESADLNSLLKAAIRVLPDRVIDAALKTDDVLTRTIEDLDLRELLENLGSGGDLEQQVNEAVTQAVKDSLSDRLRTLI